jgi:hypothetical protein
MCGSGIATMAMERGEQACLYGGGTDDAPIMLNARGHENPQAEGSNTGFYYCEKTSTKC